MFLTTAAALAALFQPVTDAEIAGTTTAIVTACTAEAAAQGVPDAKASCGCGAGVLGGAMTDVEYKAAGAIFRNLENQEAAGMEIQNLIAGGMAPESVQAMVTKLQVSAPRIGKICAPLMTAPGMASADMINGDDSPAVNTSAAAESGFFADAAAKIAKAAADAEPR